MVGPVTSGLSCSLVQPGNAGVMADFIFQANIAHYQELLATETDARKIIMIRKLLAEEEAKLAEWRARNEVPKERNKRRR